MGKKTGALIKEARTAAGMTQEQLARKVAGVSASDISKAERGEAELTQAALKAIAKATGVTQTSLLNAEKSGKTGKTAKTASTALKLTAAEKTLVELYRKADADTKKSVMNQLKGKETQMDQMLTDLLGGALGNMLGKK